MMQKIGKHKVFVAVISHGRPTNVPRMEQLIGDASWFVNKGEGKEYKKFTNFVYECGDNICAARNEALRLAAAFGEPCVQVSDDLRGLGHSHFFAGKQYVKPVDFSFVAGTLVTELLVKKFHFGGVAVTTNRLNHKEGRDFSYNLLVVNDLICMMPVRIQFDEQMALKEDYDMTIRQLIAAGGLVRCNQFLCDFPHRDNKGGANTYRNTSTELAATAKLKAKWGCLVKDHPTRPGQVALNYPAIKQARQNFLNQK